MGRAEELWGRAELDLYIIRMIAGFEHQISHRCDLGGLASCADAVTVVSPVHHELGAGWL